MTMTHTLLVFEGDRSIGEWKFKFPYGDSEAAVEPLKKLKPQYCGVTLGEFGVSAHSADLAKDHPFYRANARHIER